MMSLLPSIFLGHGAPTLAIEPGATHTFLQRLGGELPALAAILCVSAHWESMTPVVSAAAQPETIYDFFGFPDALYRMEYPAPGSVEVAARVVELLGAASLDCQVDAARGLDHGAWVPLSLIYPAATIPVLQLSVLHRGSTRAHYELGCALAPLRREGVLVLGSGNATHNLREFGPYTACPDAPPPDWVRVFDAWLREAVLGGRVEDLLAYRERAPFAAKNHPTEEHFMPLLVALGAGGVETPPRQLHAAFSYGVLSMASYAFG